MRLIGYALARRGRDPLKTPKVCILGEMVLSATLTAAVSRVDDTVSAMTLIGLALFSSTSGASRGGLSRERQCAYDQVAGTIQNFASFVIATCRRSPRPGIRCPQSFSLALRICTGVTLIGTLA